MIGRIIPSSLKVFLLYLLLMGGYPYSNGSKKAYKDLSVNNQMEPVHSVRHMARLMRRVLAEDSDADSNSTSGPIASESPTVTTVTSTSTTNSKPITSTFSTSTINVVGTISQHHREIKSNRSFSGGSAYETGVLLGQCPGFLPCDQLGVDCIVCGLNESCVYGEDVVVRCNAKANINCQGTREFPRLMNCRYCYQTPSTDHECNQNVTCRVVSSPRQRFITSCSVLPHVLCLGNRQFYKNMLCNWSKGYSWTTTLTLSIVLGGFGVDRFYLGMWQEGIGKLFSFGGLGVWTLVDVILIATGYLGPADGSLYIP